MMLALPRVLFSILLLSASIVQSAAPLTAEEQGHYLLSRDRYRSAYHPAQPDAQWVDYYAHLSASRLDLERDALAHAGLQGMGPFYAAEGQARGPGHLLVATQVRSNSAFGRKLNLRQNHDGEVHVFDAHLFWRVDKRGARLLGLGLWPEGSHPEQVMTMQAAIARFAPRRHFFGCCFA